jgi:hypothetical protein
MRSRPVRPSSTMPLLLLVVGSGLVLAAAAADPEWFRHVRQHAKRVSSQGQQDGALAYIFENIGLGPAGGYYVEFGFNTREQCSGTGPNTCELWRRGWRGLLLDGQNENATINLHKEWISARTIVSVFEKHGVPEEPDYVSIDIDSLDFYVMWAILASPRYRPRVLSVEYNSNFALHDYSVIPYDESKPWPGNSYYR